MPRYNPVISGRAWRFGANISTDDIISGTHLGHLSSKEMVPFAFEHLRPEFVKQVQPNDLIVADQNFGIGSSREEAPAILKELGVSAIVAISFARIFFRNAYNLGIPAIEFPLLANNPNVICDGDHIELNLTKGTLTNHQSQQTHQFLAIPSFLLEYLKAGGAIPLLKQKLKTK